MEEKLPCLWREYRGLFRIGAAVSALDLESGKKRELIQGQFKSLTCENEMKAEHMMDRAATLDMGNEERVCISIAKAKPILDFAWDHGMHMRGHTLVWHSQTPRWFFTKGYEDAIDAPFASRQVILKRMEHFIQDEIQLVDKLYPGLILAWDVVNEAVDVEDGREDGLRVKESYWLETLGPDFIEYAFMFARRYAPPEHLLFYNDFNTYEKDKLDAICKIVEGLKAKGLIDGVGMQSHIHLDYPTIWDYTYAIRRFADAGLEIQITELDVAAREDSPKVQEQLARRYNEVMRELTALKQSGTANITGVTFWGLTDDCSWLNNEEGPCWPLLFDSDGNAKKAYYWTLPEWTKGQTSV